MTALFDQCFKLLLGAEKGFTDDPDDKGNWTGGIIGKGLCRGTKYGISAASYPDEDIFNLTVERAKALYRMGYWVLGTDPITRVMSTCDILPPALAYLFFDAAVNNGLTNARRWLQIAVNAKSDGIIGINSINAIATHTRTSENTNIVCKEFVAQRINHMGKLSLWPLYGLGWSRRLAALPYNAMTVTG